MMKHTEEFKREAVRIALTSVLPRERIASDLGVGKSTLGKWRPQHRLADLLPAPQADLARENERVRLKNRVLKEERDILKKAMVGSTGHRKASANVASHRCSDLLTFFERLSIGVGTGTGIGT